MTQAATPPVLKHIARPWPARPVLFVDLARGVAIHENGRRFETQPGIDLVRLLNVARWRGWQEGEAPRVVYLLGGWNAESTPIADWFVAPAKCERTSYHRNPLIASYRYESGARVTIYTTAQWFGQCNDLELCQRAYERLRRLLRANFDLGVSLMGTPARTGLDLLERSLPRNKAGQPYEYPVMADDLREKLEHNIGQGRMEMLRQSENTLHVERLYVLDAIWMYSACVRHLPVLPMEHDFTQRFEGYRAGFYHVTFQVPDGWTHIGLLPVWNPKQKRPVWPATANGHTYHSYVCADELRLALDQGWSAQIVERWLFADDRQPYADPFRLWIEKLRALREACTEEREKELAPLLRAAIRALCIKAIGSLHRRGRYQQIETPVDQADSIPEDAEIIWRTETAWRWRKPIPLDKSMLKFQHPEWAAYVWGRARARLAKAALQLPRECIIALRSDAIAVTFDPGWTGSKPGEFRLKETLELQGRTLPTTSREYLDLRAANRLEVEDEEEEG